MATTNQMIRDYLKSKGVTADNRDLMLDMQEAQIPSALLMKDAEKFVQRIYELIMAGKRIVVYGDYDADGVCATTTMVRALRDLAVILTGKPGKIKYFIPHRFVDGYGMKPKTIDKLRDKFPKTDVIITVDNGIVAFDAIEYAKSLGYEVIVTDHHGGVAGRNPNCDIVVNPNRYDDDYPFKGISGTTVVYKLFLEVAKRYCPEHLDKFRSYVDFAGISTISDVMPVLYENRVYLKQALAIFNGESEHRRRFAWSAIIELLQSMKKLTKDKVIEETDFGFTFGPMINAQSRVYGIADTAVDLFLSQNTEDVRSKVAFLFETNKGRKEISDAAFVRAQETDYSGRSSIIFIDDSLGDGYIGLVAGRMAEKYNRPSVVFTRGEGGVLKGSARAGLDNLHLLDCLRQVQDLTVALGGHSGAAGLSIPEANFEAFKERLEVIFDAAIPADADVRKPADFTIDADQLTYDLLNSFERLAPFGPGFELPLFEVVDLPIDEVKAMGQEKNHLKLVCDGFDVILWNGVPLVGDKAKAAKTVSVTGQAQVNEFLNRKTMQLIARSENSLVFN